VGEDLAIRGAQGRIFDVGANDHRGGKVDAVDAERQFDLNRLAGVAAPVHAEGVEREVGVEDLGIARRGGAEGGDILGLEPAPGQRLRRRRFLGASTVYRSMRKPP
jgi:hypothetical protein